jgi:excisionase family DNA binding protein
MSQTVYVNRNKKWIAAIDPKEDRILLRVKTAASMLDISTGCLYALMSKGAIPHIRLGSSIRVPAEALRTWIRSRITRGTSLQT